MFTRANFENHYFDATEALGEAIFKFRNESLHIVAENTQAEKDKYAMAVKNLQNEVTRQIEKTENTIQNQIYFMQNITEGKKRLDEQIEIFKENVQIWLGNQIVRTFFQFVKACALVYVAGDPSEIVAAIEGIVEVVEAIKAIQSTMSTLKSIKPIIMLSNGELKDAVSNVETSFTKALEMASNMKRNMKNFEILEDHAITTLPLVIGQTSGGIDGINYLQLALLSLKQDGFYYAQEVNDISPISLGARSSKSKLRKVN